MHAFFMYIFTADSRQSKTLLTIDERDQKSLEIVFLIVICRQWGDNWQLKTLFLAIFFIYIRPYN